MPKKTNKKPSQKNTNQEDSKMDKAVQEFVGWYIKEWSRSNQKGIPFYYEIDLSDSSLDSEIIGEEEIQKYLEDKKVELGKELEQIDKKIASYRIE